MDTHQVADYLRIKERKIYDLVKEKRIPCVRV
ncbi:MAG TPA: helix-turn-helix domain-containing protein, partial [Rhodospirillaceae bacterium]|nr:helix-turn-helix domain-containing protein [Rhodospirillaceae bacterium]